MHLLTVFYDFSDIFHQGSLTLELLRLEHLTVLADKGYHTGEQIEQCGLNDISTYVSPRASSAPDKGLYSITDFRYEPVKDQYICPQGNTMRSNGKWHYHNDGRSGKSAYKFKRYTSSDCKHCESRHCCTNSSNGRYIDRSEYADALDTNTERVMSNPDYYRKRQQITEHQFGTLKRLILRHFKAILIFLSEIEIRENQKIKGLSFCINQPPAILKI